MVGGFNQNGLITIDGDYIQGGVLQMELGGTSYFDKLIINGTATFNSSAVIQVSLINGYIPQIGDQFNSIQWNALNIDFDSANVSVPAGMTRNIVAGVFRITR